jgi:glycosyltransferase 2 family protein
MKTTPQTKHHRRLISKHLKTVLLVVLTAVVVFWFSRNLHWTEVEASLARANWGLLAAGVLATSLSYVLRALRWRALLRPITRTNLSDAFAATVIGFSAVFLLGRAGEVVRPALLPLRDKRVRPAASFVTIMIERVCDLVAIVFLFAINLAWFAAPVAHEIQIVFVRQIGLVLLAGACVGLACLLLFERNATRLTEWLEKRFEAWGFVPQRLSRSLIAVLKQLSAALTVLSSPRDLTITVLWTSSVWLTIVIGNLFILRAFGIGFGLSETVFVLGWALLGSLVPTPGGAAGAFHAATVAGLLFLGVAREQAVAISILVHLVDFAPALLFGSYYFVRGQISVARLRGLPEVKANEASLVLTRSQAN